MPQDFPAYVSSDTYLTRLTTYFFQKQYRPLIDLILRDLIFRKLLEIFARFRPKDATFKYNSQTLSYCSHPYNHSFANERSIEIPIIQSRLKACDPKTILEIGYTLGHYQPFTWTVLDKYEPGRGVINQDLLSFSPAKKYAFIFSLSTFEHIGLDDSPQDPQKTLKALKRVKSWLAPSGKALITFPLGYHQTLDSFAPRFFSRLNYYRRISPLNLWRPIKPRPTPKALYGWPYNNANVVVIGEIL